MSFFARLKAIFGAKANQALDQIEDPRASLDYSLTRLQASLRQISDSLVEVSTARHTLEAQRGQAQKAVDQTEEQARQAVSLNREDLATRALERKAAAQERLNSLNSNIASLDAQVESLKTSQANMRQKIELFQAKKEELKALYDSSRAQLQVKEAASGISKDLADAGHTIQRAEARIQSMQARVEAIDNLVATGALDDVLAPEGDDIDRGLAGDGDIAQQQKARQQTQAAGAGHQHALGPQEAADGLEVQFHGLPSQEILDRHLADARNPDLPLEDLVDAGDDLHRQPGLLAQLHDLPDGRARRRSNRDDRLVRRALLGDARDGSLIECAGKGITCLNNVDADIFEGMGDDNFLIFIEQNTSLITVTERRVEDDDLLWFCDGG